MFSSFVPETELERAFVQSRNWDPDVLWRRSMLYASRKQWDVSAALMVRLARHYVGDADFGRQRQTLVAISCLLEDMNEGEKHSLFKAVAAVLAETLDDGVALTSLAGLMFIDLLLEVAMSMHQRGLSYVDIFRRLRLLYTQPVPSGGLEALRFQCRENLEKADPGGRITGEPWYSLDLTTSSASQAAGPGNRGNRPEVLGGLLLPENMLTKERLMHLYGHDRSLESTGSSGTAAHSLVTVEERRLVLHGKLEAAKAQYGLKSPEVCTALVRFVEFHIEHRESASIFKFLDELSCLCSDDSVKLNTYQVRAIYSVSNQVRDRAGFDLLAEELERAVFLRRARIVGFDVTSVAALVRLVWLWQAIDKLEEGKKFCANVLEQAGKRSPEQSFVLACFKSIYREIEKLNEKPAIAGVSPAPEWTVKRALAARSEWSALSRCDHSDEYVSSMAVLALHEWHSLRYEHSASCLEELTIYYGDCIGAVAERVGDMLWLLAATDLSAVHGFLEGLIQASNEKAVDSYLKGRFNDHLLSMLRLHGPSEQVISWLTHALECRVGKTNEGDTSCFPLIAALSAALEGRGLSSELEELQKLKDRIRYQDKVKLPVSQDPAAPPASRKLLHRSSHNVQASSSEQLRLIKVVEICLLCDALDEAETAWQVTMQRCDAEILLIELDTLTQKLLDRFIDAGMLDKAATVARIAGAHKINCSAHKVRIASAWVKTGELFSGASMLFEAFAEM